MTTDTTKKTSALHPITEARLLQWAAWQKQQDDEEARLHEEQEAEQQRKQKEQNRQFDLDLLREFLGKASLPIEATDTTIRFGEYELRAGRARYSGTFCLQVFAPTPYDIGDEWDEESGIKVGELAYANVELGAAHDLAAWLLKPYTYFPPERKQQPVVDVKLQAKKPAARDRYVIGNFADHLGTLEDRDAWINEQADEGYRLHSVTVSPSMTNEPNTLVVVMEYDPADCSE